MQTAPFTEFEKETSCEMFEDSIYVLPTEELKEILRQYQSGKCRDAGDYQTPDKSCTKEDAEELSARHEAIVREILQERGEMV